MVLPPLNQFAHAAAVAPTMDGVVGLGIYHRTSCSDLEGHLAEIQRTGATSLGVTFAHRTLTLQPSRPGRSIEAAETSEADDVAAGTDAATDQGAAMQASTDSRSESTETVRSAQAVSLNHR